LRRTLANAAIYFTNPRNTFRSGPAFAAISETPEIIETRRGRFLGPERSPASGNGGDRATLGRAN
jgi:hypothetical protein